MKLRKGDKGAVRFPNGKVYPVVVHHVELDGACLVVRQERGGRVETFNHRMVRRDGAYRTPVADGVYEERCDG
jgi:hypothetical protein